MAGLDLPVVLYLRADCARCGRRWAILADPDSGSAFYCDVGSLGREFVVAGTGSMCPIPGCQATLAPYAAVLSDKGEWLAVHDGPKAILN